MTEMVRVVGKPKTGDSEWPITFEVFLKNNKLVGSNVYFGFLGTFKEGDDLYPFLLRQNGEIDFGSSFDETDRYGQTNIRDRKIEIGQMFSMKTTFNDTIGMKEITYGIIKVERIGGR